MITEKATVWPVYSDGRRKAGRPRKVHHWAVGCAACPEVNLRPPFWRTKRELQAIADAHNKSEHPSASELANPSDCVGAE